MSGAYSTSGADGVDVWMLRELACRGLICCLEQVSGRKDLIIDSTLMKMLDRIAQAATLRKHDVDKIFRLERVPPNSVCEQRVYLTRPTPEAIKLIAEHVEHQQQQYLIQLQLCQQQSHLPPPCKLSAVVVLCVPRVTNAARSQLEEEGLADGGLVLLQPYCPGLIPLDDDLLTLELPTFFRDVFVEGDTSSCMGLAQSLQVVQSLYGAPHRTLAHGRAAHAVINALTVLQGANTEPNKRKCEIGHLFVFDRDADLVTPLLTQLTYEGSIDEHFTVQAGVVELPQNVAVSPDSTKKGPSKILLNAKDTLFVSIRNKHFAGVAPHLVKKAKEIHTRKEDSKSMTPSQMKDFVANDLKVLQSEQNSISLHLSICEAITKATKRDFDAQLTTEHGLVTGATTLNEAKSYYEDCCARQMPLNTCLRLLCLMSLTQNNGLTTKEYESLSSQLIAACGYRHMITLFELRQAGLLIVSDVSLSLINQNMAIKGLKQAASNLINRDQLGTWRALVKALKLIPDPDEAIELHNPSDMSYVFNGAYTPALPQLVANCLTRGLGSVTDALKLLPGSTVSEGWSETEGTTSDVLSAPVVLVLILGGVTFAELAAFKLAGLRTGNRIIVASTGTTTGNKIMQSVASNGNGSVGMV